MEEGDQSELGAKGGGKTAEKRRGRAPAGRDQDQERVRVEEGGGDG